MDASLLQLFTEAVRDPLRGLAIGSVRWCRPVLSIPIGRRNEGRYLTVLLDSPGPYCYLSADDPLEGAPAAVRFTGLTGATITGVVRPAGERILHIDAMPAGETREALALRLLLFGSAGRAELVRGDGTYLQHVGARLPTREGGRTRDRGDVGNGAAVPAGRFYLISRGRIGRVAPADADDAGAEHRFGPFEDAVAAVGEVGARLLVEAHLRIIRSHTKPLTRQIASRHKLMARLKAELERADDHQSLRREAETLAAYQTSVEPGVQSVELPDVYDPDHPLRIELDPSLPLRTQIEKRFKKAAKLARGRAHNQRRIEEIRREVESLQRDIDAVEGAAGFAQAMGEVERLRRIRPWLAPSPPVSDTPGRARATGGFASRFRQFDLDDMWFVLVGRNNRENDELTFHTATPSDLWFHAQHAAGSHVVLKARGNPGAPPPHILEAAASIAAYFSKSKHSGLAPVIYTQRKYVRKFRGAKPGQVTCEREKSLMVVPRLPGPRS